MHWVDRDGIRVPRRVAGHVALDFCNTWAGWNGPRDAGAEWLVDYRAFVAWAGYAELLDAEEETRLRARTGAAADQVVDRARRLRRALHAAVQDPSDSAALAVVSGFVRDAAAHLRLRSGARPSWSVEPTQRLETPLHRVAWEAGGLLTTVDLGTIGACPGSGCGWLFPNPTGRRRWCSMASCGNRAKVAAYAERHRS